MLKDTCEVCGNKDFELIGKKQINGIRTKNSSFNFKVRLVCCKKCGVVFQSPLQKLDKLEAYYATMFREEGFRPPETIIKQFSRRVDFACKFLEKSQKVMEIGCADGSTLDIFKNKGMIPYGIEPSKDNALICQKKGIKVFNGIYEKYPISEGNYFDIVCSYFVLEHLVSPVDFLSFCNRLLDLGKTLCIEVPDIGAYRKEKTSSDLLFFFEHQFHFTRETIRILLQRCGFELIEFDS